MLSKKAAAIKMDLRTQRGQCLFTKFMGEETNQSVGRFQPLLIQGLKGHWSEPKVASYIAS
jgi:hypothetical protein